MLKRFQQVLFLSTMIITPFVAMFNYDAHDLGKCLSVFFCGFSTSLFVFCFVPYLTKFYLSELITLMLGFGAELTLFFNVYHQKMNAPGWTIWFTILALCSFILPLIAYIFSERHRPEAPEEPSEPLEETTLSPEALNLKSARLAVLLALPFSMLNIAQQVMLRGFNLWFRILICVIWFANCFIFIQRYLKARRTFRTAAAQPLAPREKADEHTARGVGETAD